MTSVIIYACFRAILFLENRSSRKKGKGMVSLAVFFIAPISPFWIGARVCRGVFK
jgi:hypothetical protein